MPSLAFAWSTEGDNLPNGALPSFLSNELGIISVNDEVGTVTTNSGVDVAPSFNNEYALSALTDTTLTAAIDATTTTIPVASVAAFTQLNAQGQVGDFNIQIEGEVLTVVSVDANLNTLTVAARADGVPHAAGVNVLDLSRVIRAKTDAGDGGRIIRDSISTFNAPVDFANQERVGFYLIRNSTTSNLIGEAPDPFASGSLSVESNPTNLPHTRDLDFDGVDDGVDGIITQQNETAVLFRDRALAFFSFVNANPDGGYLGNPAKHHIRTELARADHRSDAIDDRNDTGDFTGEIIVYFEDSFAPNNSVSGDGPGLGSSDFDQGIRDGEDAIIRMFDPFVQPVISAASQHQAVQMSTFDAATGLLAINSDAANVSVSAAGGNVQVVIDGMVDSNLGTVAANLVQRIVIAGGRSANNIDLSMVTAADFTNLTDIQSNGYGGDDTLIGSPLNDSLFGGDGNDSIVGGGGDDVLEGADGNDQLQGNAGNDTLNGGDGSDTLQGGSDNDVLNGGEGDDTVCGQLGDDQLTGGNGDDRIEGEGGNDTLTESADANFTLTDAQLTGVGTDTLVDVPENVVLTGGASANQLDASASSTNVTLNGGLSNDTLIGGSAADVLNGDEGNDSLDGGPGNDTLNGGTGFDRLQGNGGADELDGGADTDRVVEIGDVDFTLADAQMMGNSNDSLANVEQAEITGGASANTIDVSGFSGSTEISGLAGNDTILGGSGVDQIDGGSGDDSIDGNTGNDVIDGGSENDIVDGGAGADQINGSSGDDQISGGTEADNITGGDGNDIVNGNDGDDTLDGGNGNDTVDGGAGNDTIVGGQGDDSLLGQFGDDQLTGGAGDDEIQGNGGNNTLVETADFDFALAPNQLTGNGTDTLSDIQQAQLTGGPSNNTIDASAFTGSTTLLGLGGNDTILGGSNNDNIQGGDGDDSLNGNDGDDSLNGDAGEDTVLGGLGSDTVRGGPDSDIVVGGGGGTDIVIQ